MSDNLQSLALRLYTVAYDCTHNGTATLRGILAAEDAINRSAPTYEEMEHELRTLLSANLIRQVKNGFAITTEGRNHFKNAKSIEGTVFERMDRLGSLISEVVEELPERTFASIKKEAYIEAYDSYYRGT